MTDLKVSNAADFRALVEANPELTHVHAGIVDLTGQLRTKSYAVEKVIKGLDQGIPLTSNLASADFTDVIYPIEGLMGGDPSFPDALVRPVPETVKVIPWESPRRNLLVLCEYLRDAEYACPRTLLLRQLDRAEEMGFQFQASFELEFRLFAESADEAFAKGYRNLTLSPSRTQYLGFLRHQTDLEFHNGLLDTLVDAGIDVESYHSETDAGFHEAVLQHSRGTSAADVASVAQTFIQAYAQRAGRIATFMARCLDDADGNGQHSHMSLTGSNGEPVFFDDSREDNVSDTMRHFIGGLQHKLPELQLLLAPNVNSYRRYAPWLNAPVAASWGIDNRTVGLRVVGVDKPGTLRVEQRLGGADANPYYVHAASLAAGLWGVENKVEPSAPAVGCSWEKSDELPEYASLKTEMSESLDRFAGSDFAVECFGPEFVRVFSANRRHQLEQYQAYLTGSGEDGEKITDWEYQRFFELA